MNRAKKQWLKRQREMPAAGPSSAMGNNVRSGGRAMGIAPYGLIENMEVYDTLPKAVKRALQESAYNWSGPTVRKKMIEGFDVIKLIEAVDKHELEIGRRKALQEISKQTT